jgi:hypothetical protein
MNSDKDGQPPRKRRRISERVPTPRTTEYLDLRNGKIDPDEQPQLDRLLNVLHKRQKIVVVAGAGISVSAGSAFLPLSCELVVRKLTPQQSPTSARPLACSLP